MECGVIFQKDAQCSFKNSSFHQTQSHKFKEWRTESRQSFLESCYRNYSYRISICDSRDWLREWLFLIDISTEVKHLSLYILSNIEIDRFLCDIKSKLTIHLAWIVWSYHYYYCWMLFYILQMNEVDCRPIFIDINPIFILICIIRGESELIKYIYHHWLLLLLWFHYSCKHNVDE